MGILNIFLTFFMQKFPYKNNEKNDHIPYKAIEGVFICFYAKCAVRHSN